MKLLNTWIYVLLLFSIPLFSEPTVPVDTTISLTQNEKEWLQKHPIIRVGMDPDYAPFEWVDEQGQRVGMAVDYLKLIEQKLGIRFHIIENVTWQEAIEMAKRGELDMLTSIVKTPKRLEYLLFTEPYRNIQTVIVDNAKGDFIGTLEYLNGKRVAVEKGYFTQELIEKNYPNIELVLAKNTLEALTMVLDDKVDAFVGDISTTNYTIMKHGLKNLRFTGQADFSNQHSFGITKENAPLSTILSKTMNTISAKEADAIFNRWMSVRIEQGIAFKTVLSYGVLLALFILLLVFWTWRLKREIKLRKASETAYMMQSENLKSIALEKSLAEAKLKESEAHYRQLTEDVSDVIWETDARLHITYISPSDEHYRGFKAEEVIGKHVFEMFTESGVDTALKMIQQRQMAEEKGIKTDFVSFEVEHICKDGRVIWGDILSKPKRDSNGTIIGYHGITREITERKQLQERIKQLAFYDTLTTLPNRLLLEDRLAHSMVLSKRTNKYNALIFFDLDNFKSLNDTYGHNVGDKLLVEAAIRVKKCIREMDTVARFGGDEFVVLLQELDEDLSVSKVQASVVAEKIRLSLAERYSLSIQDDSKEIVEHYCTASIGTVLYKSDEQSKDELLKQADKAMYQSKEAGKNTIQFFER